METAKIFFLRSGLFILFLCLNQVLSAQPYRQRQTISFMHGLGASAIIVSTDQASGTLPALTYNPRINFILHPEATLSIGIPLSVMYNFQNEKLSGQSQGQFAYELPMVINFNFGHGSNFSSRQHWGGFVGIGYGINSLEVRDTESNSSNLVNVEGTYVNLGFRFLMNYKHSLELKGYTIWGVFERKIFGVRAIYNFGGARRS